MINLLQPIFTKTQKLQANLRGNSKLSHLINSTTPIITHTNALADQMRDPQAIAQNRLLNARFDIKMTTDQKNSRLLEVLIKCNHPPAQTLDEVEAMIEVDHGTKLPLTLSSSRKREQFLKKCKSSIIENAGELTLEDSNMSATVNAKTLSYILRKLGKYQKDANANSQIKLQAKTEEKLKMQQNAELIRKNGELDLGNTEKAFIPKVISHAVESGELESKRSMSFKAARWGLSKYNTIGKVRDELQAAEEYAQLVQNEINVALSAMKQIKQDYAIPVRQEIDTFQNHAVKTAAKFKVNMAIGTGMQLIGSLVSGTALTVSGSLLYRDHPVAGTSSIIAGTGLFLNAVGHGYNYITVHEAKHSLKHSFFLFQEKIQDVWTQLNNTYSASQACFMDALHGFAQYNDNKGIPRDVIDFPDVPPDIEAHT